MNGQEKIERLPLLMNGTKMVLMFPFTAHRYVMTGVSWWGHKVDNAYWLWSFQGRILKRYQCDRFCQLLWRPRLPRYLHQHYFTTLNKLRK